MPFTPEQLRLYSQQFQLYTISGIAAIVANVLILAVLLSKKELRMSSPYLIALAFADGLNGIAFTMSGYYSNDAILYNPVPNTAMSCLRKPRVIVSLIGAQLPAFLTLAVSSERLIAVSKPLWFKFHWKLRKRYEMIGACFVLNFLTISMALPFAYAQGNTTVTSTGVCSMQQATGNIYSSAHFILITVVHTTALLLNIVAYRTARRIRRLAGGLYHLMSAEIKHIRTIATVALFSVILIAVPNLFFMLMNYAVDIFGQKVGNLLWDNDGFVFVLFSVNSSINIFIYLFLSKKFRERTAQLILCRLNRRVYATAIASNNVAPVDRK